MAQIKEYWFNTGVKPFDFNPPAGMAFMKGFKDSGNGVYIALFTCKEVPLNYEPYIACDEDNYMRNETDVVRKVESSVALKSRYVVFREKK